MSLVLTTLVIMVILTVIGILSNMFISRMMALNYKVDNNTINKSIAMKIEDYYNNNYHFFHGTYNGAGAGAYINLNDYNITIDFNRSTTGQNIGNYQANIILPNTANPAVANLYICDAPNTANPAANNDFCTLFYNMISFTGISTISQNPPTLRFEISDYFESSNAKNPADYIRIPYFKISVVDDTNNSISVNSIKTVYNKIKKADEIINLFAERIALIQEAKKSENMPFNILAPTGGVYLPKVSPYENADFAGPILSKQYYSAEKSFSYISPAATTNNNNIHIGISSCPSLGFIVNKNKLDSAGTTSTNLATLTVLTAAGITVPFGTPNFVQINLSFAIRYTNNNNNNNNNNNIDYENGEVNEYMLRAFINLKANNDYTEEIYNGINLNTFTIKNGNIYETLTTAGIFQRSDGDFINPFTNRPLSDPAEPIYFDNCSKLWDNNISNSENRFALGLLVPMSSAIKAANSKNTYYKKYSITLTQ